MIFNRKPDFDSWVSPSLEVNDTVMEIFILLLRSHRIPYSDNNDDVASIIMTQKRDECKRILTETATRQ
jgi:hypothetical protein